MSDTNIEHLLPHKYAVFFYNANICTVTAGKIMKFPNYKLKEMGFNDAEIIIMKDIAATHCMPKIVKVSEINDSWKRISFGCKSLDDITKYGIPTRGATEIYGASGTGKTQMVMQLALMVQLPEHLGGLEKSAVIICTEDAFPIKRLGELQEGFQQKYHTFSKNYCDNIFIEHAYDSGVLLKMITSRLPTVIEKSNVGLIAIDSIAAVFRDQVDYIERAKCMRQIVHTLLNLSDKFNCAVLFINQISATSENYSVPSLGIIWSNLISMRLYVKREKQGVRKMLVRCAPDLPKASGNFFITRNGLADELID